MTLSYSAKGKRPYRYPADLKGVPRPASRQEGVERFHEQKDAENRAKRDYYERAQQWRLG